MNGRRLNWDKAKTDSIKGMLAPTGEEIDPYEEVKLEEWHAAKKGVPLPVEPIERDMDTMDAPDNGRSLVNSVVAQVELRERARASTIAKIENAQARAKAASKARHKGSRKKKR